MQSKRKSSWKILVVAAAANLLAVSAQAALDAPHGGGTISCLTCHQMTSTYPKLLPPLGGTPVDVEDSYANRTCLKCHNGDGVIKLESIITSTHSRAAMGGNPAYGDWSVECWVCHNEHMQEQNIYNGSTYGMYIRRSINLANIKKPDGTSFGKTGIMPVVFTGPATFADDVSPYNGICEICHTQTSHFRNDGSGDDHGGKGGSDCVSCHNHDTAFTGGAVHNIFITDDNKTGDVNTKCTGCHTNYASAPETAHSACAACHTTAPTLLDSTFPTANGQVDDDGSSMFANLAAAGYTFNGTTGRLNDPDGTDIAGVGGDNVFAPVKCGVCHAAKPDALAAVPAEHGGHPVTDWNYSTITNDCIDCHKDGGKGTIEGVHSNTCTICHVNPAGGDFARKIGDAANGVDGNALLASGRNGDCLTCHPSATYTKTKIHHDTVNATATPTSGCTTACHNTTTGHAGNHDTLVAIQNPNCQGCHNAAASIGGAVPVDATSGNLVHDYCTSCHVNPSNDLIATVATPTAHATTMNNADGTTATNNGGGTCTACHTAYFDGHGHAHTMSTVSLCVNCHDAATAPYTTGTDVHNATDANGCFTCHNAATGALQGSAGGKTGGDCQNCHTAYFNGHSHAHTMPTVALCTSCHTASAAPYTGAGQVHATNTCATCHDLDATPTGALIGSATGKVGGENCQGCHTTYFDGHDHGGTAATPNHTQTITKDALCGSCHGNGLSGPDAITAPYTAGTEVHSTFDCMTCHSPINGGPLGSAANWGATWSARATGTCATCHTDAFSGHSHAHTFTATADCATCHGNPTPLTSNARDAVAAPFVGAGEVHAASGCATCHDGATGALIGSAIGHAAATGCIDCHTATWTATHTGAPGVTHASRVETDAACTICHGNPTPGTSNARDAQASPFVAGGEVHAANACATCHTGSNNGGLNSGPFTNADQNTAGNCSNCHAVTSSWGTIHIGAPGVDHTTRVDGLAECIGCHDATAGGPNGLMPVSMLNHKVHDRCSVCHALGGALNTGNTIYGNQPIARGNCGTCHTATYFDSHVHGTTGGYVEHDVTYNALVDLSQVSTPGDNPCADCHSGNNADADGIALNSWADILSEHVTGCARCHSYNDLGDDGIAQGTPPQATNDTTIVSGAGVTCVTCHTPKLDPDPASDHGYLPHDADPDRTVVTWTGASGVGTDPDCLVCHNDGGAEVVYSATTHGGDCTKCHAGVPNPLQSTTTLATAMPDGGAGTNNGGGSCLACHVASYTVHTVNSINQATSLHDKVDTAYAAANNCDDCHGSLDTWVEIVALHTDCNMCHDSDLTVVKNAITTGRSSTNGFMGSNTTVNCDTCHVTDSDFAGGHANWDLTTLDTVAIKDAYGRGHGTSPDTVHGEHNNLANSTGSQAQAGVPAYTGKLSGAYGGLKDADYNCNDCHDIDNAPDTLVVKQQKRIQEHSLGNCLLCHSYSNVTAEIAAGAGSAPFDEGAGGTVTNCETCHSAANNPASPTNATYMYQYDGNRHHTTAHAQAGDCTWCHGDPRPAIVSSGFAATASTIDGDGDGDPRDDGWIDDYNTATPTTIPKQAACRLCHTNYGTDGAGTPWSVNVNSATGGNHGYNITGTAAQRTTGLTVWANNFNAGLSGATNSNYPDMATPSKVTQTQIHRIEANNGTSMIKVYDYGSCLGCHSVQVMHAAPVPGADYPTPTADIQTVPWDTLRYAPGRAVFNLLRGTNDNNQAWDNHRLRYQNGYRTIAGGSPARGKNYYKNVGGTATDWYFNSQITHSTVTVPLHASFSNFNSQAGAQAVYFTDITAPVIPDGVQFLSASWNGVTVTVQATNDDGCAALSARTRPDGVQRIAAGGFTGTGLCTGTFNLGSITGVTLDIETTNAAGTISTGNTITNNSNPAGSLSLSSATYSVGENGTSVTITVNRNFGSTGAVSIDYATANGTATAGSDYTAASGTLNWAAGDSAAKQFTISIINDGTTESNETVNITLSNPVGGPGTGTTSAVLTIVDDDLPGTVNITTADASVAESVGTVTITASRSGGSAGAVTATVTASGTATGGDTDYSLSSTTFSWAAGDTADKTITITVVDDMASESSETVILTITGTTGGLVLGADVAVTTTITDNDAPILVTRIDSNWMTSVESTATTNPITTTYSVPSGSNRVLVVTVTNEASASDACFPVTGITYGGQQMTIAAQGQFDAAVINNYNNCATIAYLKESGIQAASNTSLSLSPTGTSARTVVVTAATYQNVHQTASIAANSNGANSGTGALTTSVNNSDRGRVIYVVSFNAGTGNNNQANASTGFTRVLQHITAVTTGYTMHVGEQTNTTAGTPINISVTPAATSNRSAIATLALPPL